MRYIKQFGLQRTGTNYLAWLVERNFRDVCVLQGILAWKHGPIEITFDGSSWPAPDGLSVPPMPGEIPELPEIRAAQEAGELRYLFIAKNPYSWLFSFAKYMAARRMRIDLGQEIPRWNERNREYADFTDANPRRACLVRYEDLVKDFASVLTRIGGVLGLTAAETSFVDTDRVTLAGGDRMKGDDVLTNVSFDATFYTERRYMAFYAEEMVAALREVLDEGLCKRLGYEIV